MARVRSFRLGLAGFLLLASACGFRGCGARTGLAIPTGAGTNAYNCTCNITGPFGFCPSGVNCTVTARVCVPPALNVNLGGSLTDVSQLVADCSSRVCGGFGLAMTQEVAFANGAGSLACSAVSNDLGLGHVGTQFVDPSCDMPCPVVPCDAAFATVCVPTTPAGVTKCCTEVTLNTAGCSSPARPSTVVCVAPYSDPPDVQLGGLWSFLTANVSNVVVDPSRSTLTIFPEGGPPEGLTGAVSGEVDLTGRPCRGAPCNIGIGAGLEVGTLTFDTTVVLVHVHVEFSGITVIGASTFEAIALDSTGAGTLPEGSLSAAARGHSHRVDTVFGITTYTEDKDVAFSLSPNIPAAVQVDFARRSFALTASASVAANPDEGTPAFNASVVLVGAIDNQPPRADAGADQSLECQSPAGATVTLSGSASDPDGNLMASAWYRGPAYVGEPIGGGDVVGVEQPLGAQEYNFTASDTRLQSDQDRVDVTVSDTTGPVLDSVTIDPDCLWPPNHKYVRLELGREIIVQAHDACQVAPPSVRIINVQSSDPDNSIGDGNTTQDAVFSDAATCLRAERSGLSREGRIYTITVEATDVFGNATTATTDVRVPHDQGRAHGGRCPALDPSQFLEDTAPACALGTFGGSMSVVESTHLAAHQSPATRRGGCTASGSSRPTSLATTLAFMAIALFAVGAGRRRRG